MKPMLVDRNHHIPNGFVFYQPETQWRPRRGQSFQAIVQDIMRHRAGNLALAAQHNWAMTQAEIEDELDAFNARVCVANGWGKYVMHLEGGGLPPKPIALSSSDQKQINAAAGLAKKIWAGVKTINSWIDSGEGPVPAATSSQRASVCTACPKNGQGDFTTWFTKPAAGAIQKQIAKLSDRKLSTPHDDRLNICEVCLCPLKLKVHTPISHIKEHLDDNMLNDLRKVGGCWIIAELAK